MRAACRQVLTTEAKAVVVDELKKLCAGKKIIVLRDLLVKPTSKRRSPTVTALSSDFISRLGTEKELALAQHPRSPMPPSVLANLQSCVKEAIPGCTLGRQVDAGGRICGIIFTGHYAMPP